MIKLYRMNYDFFFFYLVQFRDVKHASAIFSNVRKPIYTHF